MSDMRFSLQLSTFYDRFQRSLFYIPAIYVVGAGFAAWGATRLDQTFRDELPQLPILLPTTVDSARAILSAIAGATITVAGVVFSLTVIAVQLASSQFSPRALRGLLRDRFSQNAIGITVATFTYCLLVLAVTRGGTGQPPDEPLQNIAVTLAVVMSVVAVLAIVAFLDHSARSMQVGEIIRRAATETHEAIHVRCRALGEVTPREPAVAIPDREPDDVIRARREGWVQLIHARALFDALPPGATARLTTRPGGYVLRGRPLLEVRGQVDEWDAFERDVRRTLAIGDERTVQQDVAFGIRQIVDIALRALSPSVNDPTTAIEAMFRLGGIVRELSTRDLPPRVMTDEDDDRTLVRDAEHELADYIRYAFRQIREVAVPQAGVMKILVRILGEIAEEMRRHGVEQRVDAVRTEVRLALAALERHGHLEDDLAPIRATAEQYGLA